MKKMQVKKTSAENIEELMEIRLEMLREVNGLAPDAVFAPDLVAHSREYFLHGDQTTVFAMDGERIAGCASISYITVMPTFDHPTGRRAHLMNIYTRAGYRRQGVGRLMVQFLIDEAKARGATEISLDATQKGVPLYQSLGFAFNGEAMNISLG